MSWNVKSKTLAYCAIALLRGKKATAASHQYWQRRKCASPWPQLCLSLEVRQHCFAKKSGLSDAVIAPDFQHDVRASSLSVVFNSLDALLRCPCDWEHFT